MPKMTLKQAKELQGIKGFWPNLFFTLRSKEFMKILLILCGLVIVILFFAVILQILHFDFSVLTKIHNN